MVAPDTSAKQAPTAARTAKLVWPPPIVANVHRNFALFKPAHYFRAMADCCCTPPPLKLDPHRGNSAYRRVLWVVLAINAVMFLVEIGAGVAAGSASLQADALDFLGDAANYAISLLVVGMPLRYRATAALAKGATMGLFGLWVIGTVIWHLMHGTLPSALTMGAIGFAALVANAVSFGMLWVYREGDANMRSAWICTRNDVLGNLAVLFAALCVFGTGTGWPDMAVAAIMAALALQGAAIVMRQSFGELRQPVVAPAE
jgi:Co/Zn/Cd efflux system component